MYIHYTKLSDLWCEYMEYMRSVGVLYVCVGGSKLFNECSKIIPHFHSLTIPQKITFIMSYPNKQITDLIYSMYSHHKSLSFV